MTWLCSFGGQRRQPRQAALLARTTTLQGFTADNGALTKTLDVKSCERRALCGKGRAPGFERSDGTCSERCRAACARHPGSGFGASGTSLRAGMARRDITFFFPKQNRRSPPPTHS
jgi:hypothetical protein